MSADHPRLADPPRPAPGLRERKKRQTRDALRREALRLFEQRGYDETTIEQIAAAADVSPSTFFRYFPTKEDVVLSDEYDPMVAAAILARPADEPLAVSIRRALVDTLETALAEEQAALWTRYQLVMSVPSLRARISEGTETMRVALVGALAQRAGRPEDDFEVNVLAGALAGGLTVAAMRWLGERGGPDLVELLDRTVELLAPALRLPGDADTA